MPPETLERAAVAPDPAQQARPAWKIAWCHNGVTGGAKRAAFEMVRELHMRGHRIDEYVLCDEPVEFLPLRPFTGSSTTLAFGKRKVPDWRPYALQTYGRLLTGLARARRLERALARAAERINRGGYDYAHIDQHPFCPAAGLLPYLSVPSVVYSHEASGKRYERRLRSAAGRGLKAAYRAACDWPIGAEARFEQARDRERMRAAGLLLANSHYSAEILYHEYGLQAETCYLGVDDRLFRPLGLPVEPMVLSVGRLVPAKRHDLIVRAVAEIGPDDRPAVVIATPETASGKDTGAELSRLAIRAGVDLTIRHGPDQRELSRLYNQAIALAFVPVMEPLGLVALEAMACGTPVIGVREAGVRETVLECETGLLVDPEPAGIAGAIRTLQANPALRERLGTRAAAWVRSEWTWPKVIDRYERIVAGYLRRSR